MAETLPIFMRKEKKLSLKKLLKSEVFGFAIQNPTCGNKMLVIVVGTGNKNSFQLQFRTLCSAMKKNCIIFLNCMTAHDNHYVAVEVVC